MNKFFLFFLTFSLFFLVESCSCGREKSIYDEYAQYEDEKNCGTLNEPCCLHQVCEEGLYCEAETNICLEEKEEPDNGLPPVVVEEPDEEEDDEDTPDEDEDNPCKHNPCAEVENSTKECEPQYQDRYVCVCRQNYEWDSSYKICKPKVKYNVSCKGLPENAKWNEAISIKQQWDGSKWSPSEQGTYNEEPSTTECRFICKENYEWDGESCNALTRKKECTGLPEHASWNTVSEITQTWDGYSWEPPLKASFSTTSSTKKCRFICDDGYYYDSSTEECLNPCMCNMAHATGVCTASSYYSYVCECEENYNWNSSAKTCDPATRTVKCPSENLPANTQWNTVSGITQTWNGTNWTPDTEISYSETATTKYCRYKCRENYDWDSSTSSCKPKELKNVECKRLPEHAEPNTATHIDQKWSGSSWYPSDIYAYNETPSESYCYYKCVSEFHREYQSGSGQYLCVSNSRKAECEGLPQNGHWNSVDKIDQVWVSSWPSNTTLVGKYNPNPSDTECRFDCDAGFFWNGSDCVMNPCGCRDALSCQSKNCAGGDNTTGLCISKAADKYVCECEPGFYWWEDQGCIAQKPLTLGNICTGQDKCYGNSSSAITCPTSAGDDFFGQDAYYAGLGICAQQSFSIKPVDSDTKNIVFDNNTGLEWQRDIPTTKYSWKGANEYCQSLLYNGYTGWRLPAPQELMTLLLHTKSPAADSWSLYFPALSSTDSSIVFWTSKEFKSNPDQVFAVSVYNGKVSYSYMKVDKSAKVICVWGDELPTASFTTQTIGTGEDAAEVVVDSTTGLMWQKNVETGKTWKEALRHCEESNYAGLDDWRLPNKNELASLIDFDMYDPATEFPDMPNTYLWSSTSFVNGQGNAYRLYSRYGAVDTESKSSSATIDFRCVRNLE